MQMRRKSFPRGTATLSLVVAAQALAATFFVLDFLGDIRSDGWTRHLILEAGASLALLTGILVGTFYLRSLVEAARRDELAVAAASGAMTELIGMRFAQWGLTPAEADVALFALKGLDAAEIARLRGAAAGTVRAQLTRVYAKAGVTSHSALVALFLDDLIETPIQ